ncbi:TPA: histidine--tRNA ligase [Candidatus Ventrenecus stercoripullorum]|nr:histidine--tRNA ligase [Candidatus Ventrenecus stercoripullorum]
MGFIKTPTKGMRDFLPQEMSLREYVLNVMKDTYENFGFSLIGTPTVEHIENLTSNQGGENEKLIFKILKRGEKLDLSSENVNDLVDSGLRYDLTVPLSRFYASHMNELPSPFRAFQTGYSYRAERPQRGRYRELMQCDLDILGEKTCLAEIELITAVIAFLKKLDFQNFKIRINDRKILLKMIEYVGLPLEKVDSILIILDKMDKISLDGVKSELESLGLESSKVESYLKLFTNEKEDVEAFCNSFDLEQNILENLKEIMDTVKDVLNVELVFDPTLVRGMGYYTGPIFEISADGLSSSIGGGGRYDKMIENFAGVSVPAVGFSVGFERLLLLLEERGFIVPETKEKIAFVLKDHSKLKETCDEAKKLRSQNKIVKIVYRNKNFKFQKENLEKENYEIKEIW